MGKLAGQFSETVAAWRRLKLAWAGYRLAVAESRYHKALQYWRRLARSQNTPDSAKVRE